jgi:proteasome lid subunit RPN8/RPN11
MNQNSFIYSHLHPRPSKKVCLMMESSYQYALELYSLEGTLLGQAAVEVDWEPARESASLQAIRRAGLSADVTTSNSTIAPLWHAQLGEPYLDGFRIIVKTNGTGVVPSDFPTAYFKTLATKVAAYFVEKGRLKLGDKFQYLIAAFPRQQSAQAASKLRFTAEEVTPLLPLKETALTSIAGQAMAHGIACAEDFPVFIPQQVLDEAATLAREAGAQETGGILIGHIHRDPSVPEVFVEVTAQIPARHTEADLTKLTFTAETWTEVQAAICLRRKNELMLGWFHSHPVRHWSCKDCPVERQMVCELGRDFFSSHDHALHRTVFPRAFAIALVVNDVAYADPTFSLFGWRRGMLESRGFHVIGASRPFAASREAGPKAACEAAK